MKKTAIGLLTLVLIFGLALVPLAQEKKVVVGNKNFTEQYIIGELMKQVLEANGFKVTLKADMSTMTLRRGLEAGDIDICAEYTGTAWMTHLGYPYYPDIGHEALHATVKAIDKTENNLEWLQPIWNHNSYAFAVWPGFAEEHDIKTLPDLAQLYGQEEGKIDTFIDFEFSQRPDGLPALEEAYDFHIAQGSLKTGAPGASVMALENKQTKVGMVFATDAAIAEHNWVVLQDTKNFWPPYDLTPVVRGEILEKYPEIKDILNELVQTFPGGGQPWSPDRMSQAQKVWSALNGKVDIEKMDAKEAAREYLVQKGLIEE